MLFYQRVTSSRRRRFRDCQPSLFQAILFYFFHRRKKKLWRAGGLPACITSPSFFYLCFYFCLWYPGQGWVTLPYRGALGMLPPFSVLLIPLILRIGFVDICPDGRKHHQLQLIKSRNQAGEGS